MFLPLDQIKTNEIKSKNVLIINIFTKHTPGPGLRAETIRQ